MSSTAPTPRDDRSIPSTTPGTTDHIPTLYFGGIVLLIVGVAVMAGNWPSTEVGPDSVVESGNKVLTFIGAATATVGQILLSIAIIATGVRMGIKRH